MRMPLLACSLAAVLAAPVACDLQKTGSQLLAKKVMVGTVLSTPRVEIQPAAVLGLDAGFDAGSFPFDSGFALDGGAIVIEPHTAAYVFFGTRTSESLEVPPEGEPSATVSIAPAGGAAIALKNDGNGTYSKTSVQDPAFTYQPGKTYEFRAALSGETFVGDVENAPALERIAAFHPAKGYVEQNAGAALTFTRPDPVTQELTLGFISVFPISDTGEKGEPTYTNIPKAPLEFLKLVVWPSDWKQLTVTIPGTAFPQAKKTYLVVFQSVKSGGPKSENLFSGSALLAGTADVAVVRTR